MAHILISFLGKSPKQDGQYRQANYCFEDGKQETARFFSVALKRHIQPNRLIMLGTSGSMWDVLCADDHAQWLDLSEAVEANAVTQTQLDAFCQPVSEALNIDCQLQIIPYGDNLAEQIDILQIMAAAIQAGDTVSLDLTHGLRHLPMLGLLSAMYLQTARNITINGIYYGALDRTQNELTPVMQLNGLLTIAEWLHALDGFNKTGNLTPFSKLLQHDGMAPETAQCLEDAAFFENTLNVGLARKRLKTFSKATQNGLTGIGGLFEGSLKERIAWHKENRLYQRQQSNAYFYLKQGDYLRAATLGYEAFITLNLQQDTRRPRLNAEKYEDRQLIKDALKSNRNPDYKLLSYLRNALAHGISTPIVEATLSSKASLHAELERLFNKLLPQS